MPIKTIKTFPVNSGSGDSIKEAFDKCNDNFTYLDAESIPTKITAAIANISATFSGGTVSNATVFQGITTVSNSTPSTSSSTGALIVAGGIGVNGDFYANSDVSINGNLYIDVVDSDFTVNGNLSVNVLTVSTVDADSSIIESVDAANATIGNASVASLDVTGSLNGILGNLTTASDNSSITGNLRVVNSNITFVGSSIDSASRIRANTFVTGNNPSIDTTSGALICGGGAGINGNINVGGIAKFAGNIIVADNYVPIASNSSGVKGQVTFDDTYIYICTDTDTWKRSLLDGAW
jgi:hypothetical protein